MLQETPVASGIRRAERRNPGFHDRRIVACVEHGPVRKPVTAERIQPHELQLIVETHARGTERVADDVGHGEQCGTRVKSVPAGTPLIDLAPGVIVLFENSDPRTPAAQMDRGCQAPESGADDDNVLHTGSSSGIESRLTPLGSQNSRRPNGSAPYRWCTMCAFFTFLR